MKKANIKPLVLSALSALAFGAVGTAGTFALFTDKAETTVQVQAGIVDVDATISVLAFYELGVTTPITETDSNGALVNSIGGTAKIDGSTLVLNKWAPGDKVTFKLTTKNKSNVKILTKLRETHSTTSSVDLYEALNITYARESGIAEDKIFHWSTVEAAVNAEGDTISVINVTIEFPNHGDLITAREEGLDNHFQDSNCTIVFSQQAVQGNAETVDLVAQWNAILAGEGVNDSLTAAIAEVEGTEAQLKSERIVWNAANDQFYYEEEVPAADRYQYFKAYDAMPTIQSWSIYATSSWTSGNDIALKGVGFDAGSQAASIETVSYTGETTARTNRIYTNSASTNITINAPLDTVQHYGVAGTLDIQAVAGSSYHEFGKVAFAQISKGRIALESTSKVSQIHVEKKTESTFDEIIIAKHADVELPTLSRDDVTIPSGGTLVVALQEGTEAVTEQTDLDYVWLTKQGVFEQVAISDNAESAVSETASTTVYADQVSNQETQTAAQQIANNIAEQVVIDTVTYNVSVDTTSRDIVLTNATDPTQTASAEATAAAIAEGEVVTESGLDEEKKEAAAEEAVAIVTIEEDDQYVARIGATGYTTLQAAWNVGANKTVILLKDLVQNGFYAYGTYTLDLDGHTLTLRGHSAISGAFGTDGGANSTHTNLTVLNGTLNLNGAGYSNYGIYNYGTLTLKDLTVNSACQTVIYSNGQSWGTVGTTTLDNVTINATHTSGTAVAAYALKNSWTNIKPVVVIKNSTISAAYNAVMMYGTDATIENTSITVTNNNALWVSNSAMGSGLYGTITVKGLTNINAGSDYKRLNAASGHSIVIVEGTYNFDPTKYVDLLHYGVTENSNDTFTVAELGPACYAEIYDNGWVTVDFDTLADAFVASKQSEDNEDDYLGIYLYRDVTEDIVFSMNSDTSCQYCIDIDLEGHTLSGNIVLNGTTMSVVGSGTLAANVTVNDVTDSEGTHNAALNLGYYEDESNAVVSTGVITLNGEEASLNVNNDCTYDSERLVNNGGYVYVYQPEDVEEI